MASFDIVKGTLIRAQEAKRLPQTEPQYRVDHPPQRPPLPLGGTAAAATTTTFLIMLFSVIRHILLLLITYAPKNKDQSSARQVTLYNHEENSFRLQATGGSSFLAFFSNDSDVIGFIRHEGAKWAEVHAPFPPRILCAAQILSFSLPAFSLFLCFGIDSTLRSLRVRPAWQKYIFLI